MYANLRHPSSMCKDNQEQTSALTVISISIVSVNKVHIPAAHEEGISLKAKKTFHWTLQCSSMIEVCPFWLETEEDKEQ